MANFSAALSEALSAHGSQVGVVRVADESPTPDDDGVIGELVSGSAESVAACAATLNNSDVAVIHFDHHVYGGVDGDEVLGVVEALRVPLIVVVHDVLKDPTPHQHWVLDTIIAKSDRVVVMSESARQRLCGAHTVDQRKVVTIPHGATIPTGARPKRASRPTLLTWGLLRPGKGIERVIDAMVSLRTVAGRPRYLVVGRTHPDVEAADGEAYRDALIERAKNAGVADCVSIDARHYDTAMLTSVIQSASLIVLPYDSKDQVTSGVLVDAIASGRPVVATAFPHAVELLSGGAGTFVDHDDPDALALALRQVLTQPRLSGSMAAKAREMGPELEWSSVAATYIDLAQRILAERRVSR